MTTLNELTNQQGTDLRAIFTNSDKTLHIIEDIENEVRAFVPDTSTPKGRKEIKSLAHKVSRSKTAIDSAGKDLVKGWKDQSKAVDADRKIIRDRLDALKNEVLIPVKRWEEEEAARLRKEEIRKEILADMDEAKQLDALFDRELLLKKEEQELRIRAEELARLERIAIEKEQEKARLIEQEKRIEEQRIESENIKKQLKIEAEKKKVADELHKKRIAEQAKIEAEKKAQKDIDDAIRKANAAEEAEKLAVLVAEKQRQDHKEAIAKAIAKTKLEAQRKVEKEEKEKADKLIKNQAIEKARAEQESNKKRVKNEILADLVNLGISNEQAKIAILAIEAGKVRNISINF